jgi:hypothetical protein
MTRKSRRPPAGLDRLIDALVEDILATPDADLLAEAHADRDAGATMARRAFEKASRTVTLRRLSASERRGRRARRVSANIRALDPKTARGWLDEFMASNPETASTLTSGARRGDKLSDEDVYVMLEALQERGILEHGDHGRR